MPLIEISQKESPQRIKRINFACRTLSSIFIQQHFKSREDYSFKNEMFENSHAVVSKVKCQHGERFVGCFS